MKTIFDPSDRLIVVTARVSGPNGTRDVQLALDTGATTTVIRTATLLLLGYNPADSAQQRQLITGSGVEPVPYLTVEKIEALGQQRAAFSLIAHTLPPSAPVDGLLGLDFFRDQRLTIDFRKGVLTL